MAGSFRAFSRSIFILLNLLIAIAFIVASYVSWFNPVKYWYLGLLNVGAFYLLAGLLIFLIVWIIARKRYVFISIICLVITWGPIQNLFPLRLPYKFEIQKNTEGLRFMSWNVNHFDIQEHKTHPEVKQQMINLINRLDPDIACFQEMVASDSITPAINYLPDFLQQFKMKWEYFSYDPKIDFDDAHHFGIITFSKYPIINRKTFSYPPHNYNSIFQYLDIVKGSDTFRIFNIHLQSLRFSTSNLKYIDDPSFKNQEDLEKSKNVLHKFKAGFLKREVQSGHIKTEMEKSPYPVIVCGDFNDLPNSYAYNHIGSGLKNAFKEKGWGAGRTFSGISPTLRIDNIFVDPVFKVNQYTRIEKKLSDHFPIVADIVKEKQ